MGRFRSRPRRHSAQAALAGPHRRLLFLEPLEDRVAPAAYTVNNAGDLGAGVGLAGDLRYCITQANANPGADTIQFAISGAGVQTINLTAALPTITDPVVIDGYTQAGASPNTLATGDNAVLAFELNGASAGTGVNGMTITAGNCTIRGLVINRFSAAAIVLSGAAATGDIIEGNLLGTDATGVAALGNGGDGVAITNASNNTLGGMTADARNLISGNTGDGIDITSGSNAVGNVIEGNFIGTDMTGTAKLGNVSLGVYIGAANNTVGGIVAGARNVISANADGVRIDGNGNQVLGNYIGTDVTGAHALGNNFEGVIFLNGGNNTVGGTTTAARNVISGNGEVGLWISLNCNSDVVQGNYIGTDATGSIALANAIDGVRIIGDANNTIGGVAAGAGNLISGNKQNGISISDSGAAGNLIAGNYIGTNAAGTAALGNLQYGIALNSASVNSILGNTISGNASDGVNVNGNGAPVGTVSWYKAEGNANDSVGGNNGTLQGGAGFATGEFGQAFNFNGSNQYVSTAKAILNTTGAFTVQAWINPAAIGNYEAIVSEIGTENAVGQYQLRITPTGNVQFLRRPGGNAIQLAESFEIFPIKWTYVVGVYDGTNLSIYVDGAQDTYSVTSSVYNAVGTGETHIGAAESAAYPFDGPIDEVALFNRALSPTEIKQIYDSHGAGLGGATIQGNKIGTNTAGTAALGNGGSGLSIVGAAGNTIGGSSPGNGNIISANNDSGINLDGTGADYNAVAGNYIGVAADGATPLGNVSYGINVFSGATGNTIGGTSPSSSQVIAPGAGSVSNRAPAYPGNVISGNSSGVAISGAGTNNNVVEGNFIGTDSTGGVAVTNGDGVDIYDGATLNVLGGTVDGSGNLISGNTNPSADGVNISGTGTSNNTVEGNYIGTTASGTGILGNGSAGVGVLGGASNNTIGSVQWGQALVSNAGNLSTPYGIVVAPSGQIYVATYNNSIVQVDPTTGSQSILSSGGMLVGVYALALSGSSIVATTFTSVVSVDITTGTQTLVSDLTNASEGPTVGPDGSLGIVLESAGTYLISDFDNNRILRVDPATGNRTVVTTGNFLSQPEFLALQADGTLLVASSANGNVVKVNPATGAQSVLGTYISPYGLAVAGDGSIFVSDGSTPANSRLLRLDPTTGAATTVAQGGLFNTNYVGDLAFEPSGTLIAASQQYFTPTPSSLVRLTAGAARNVISGNAGNGVTITDSGTAGNLVVGNYIGINAAGTAALGNLNNGVLLTSNATNNTVGGSASGAGNIISGNGAGSGVLSSASGITVFSTTGNTIQGNTIGADVSGSVALENYGEGIHVESVSGLLIDRNVIAANFNSGIQLDGSLFITLTGNTIGLSSAGNQALANGGYGVFLVNSSHDNTIGGVTAAARNIISANKADGIRLLFQTTGGNVIEGNYIGTDASGTVALGNQGSGIDLNDANTSNVVGGTAAGAGNVISGNAQNGVVLEGSFCAGNVVEGNYIRTDATGATKLGNQTGVLIQSGASGNTIGGLTATPGTGAGNVISGNSTFGIHFDGSNGNLVEGNLVGTDTTGLHALGNSSSAVSAGSDILVGASNNTIGGTTAAARNVVAGNVGGVIAIFLAGTGNIVQGNYVGVDITGNTGLSGGGGIISEGSGNLIGGLTATPGTGAGNIISGASVTGEPGVDLIESANDHVEGNLIGLGADGTTPVGNYYGIALSLAVNETIGGTAAGAGNVIAASTGAGILDETASGGTTIVGNFIGTDVTGTLARGNGTGIFDAAPNETVTNNLISGNTGAGLLLGDPGAVVQGNLIGARSDGLAALPNASDGIYVQSDHNTIGGAMAADRNIISGNQEFGVEFTTAGAHDNLLEGNYIGTDATGATSLANQTGILIQSGATNNTIGGNVAGAGNVISGNASDGVYIASAATGNVVEGNLIGTDATGNNALANKRDGVETFAASGNLIGTNGDGVNDALERNIISGNAFDGVAITTGGNNIVAGNYIGLGADGSTIVANSNNGVDIFASHDNIIGVHSGGTTVNAFIADERNLIAGNVDDGVLVVAYARQTGTTHNVIAGNYIGTDASGTQARGNGQWGLTISSNAGGVLTGDLFTLVGSNADGIDDSSEGNLISGNGYGGILFDQTSANTVAGNFIGIDHTGTVAIPNGSYGTASGLRIVNGSTNNTIGGTTSAARNLVSGNSAIGILVQQLTTTGNVIEGNYVGTDVTGSKALPNKYSGIDLDTTTSNTIGGSVTGAGNLVSANGQDGIGIHLGSGNLVAGNLVGTDVTGTMALGNAGSGIESNGSSGNTIGGTTAAARNIVSGNAQQGVLLDNSGATGNVIEGNYIGTDATGTQALANAANGVLITTSASGNTIGGAAPGAGNVISGNNAGTTEFTGSGVELFGTGTSANVVLGNRIGTDATGANAIANAWDGVLIADEANNNTIGGTSSAARNLISGNGYLGVDIITAAFNVIQGNYIGTNSAGSAALANLATGIGISAGGSNDTIGGAAAGAGNVISGNGGDGVYLYNFAAGDVIQGNTIGLDAAGDTAIANSLRGIFLGFGANNNLIGGIAAGAGNVISGNTQAGIDLSGSTGALVSGNTIAGNLVGTNAAGTAVIGNNSNGVELDDFSPNNTVGGTEAAARNIISANAQNGIVVTGSSSTGNLLEGNYVGTDVTGTVDLGNGDSGVAITGVSGNTIGGDAAGAGNVVSGNHTGIVLSGDANTVEGNTIGTNATGTAALGNDLSGIEIESSNNTIGGMTPAARNVISANGFNGIRIDGAAGPASGNVVQGNFIGTDATGSVALGNVRVGIYVLVAADNTIGGLTAAPGTGAGNVISGNGLDVNLGGKATVNNLVEGNLIGPDVSGTISLGSTKGVQIVNGATNNTIGGTVAGARNVISGCGTGVLLTTPASAVTGNVVAGNFIGTDISGTKALANTSDGIRLQSGVSGNTIGGTTYAARNIISGNIKDGIVITDSGTTGNVVEGNYIGTDASGNNPLGNGSFGVYVLSSSNTVGGVSQGAGNVISGNASVGVLLSSPATDDVVVGNFIGTNAAGTARLGNQVDGVDVFSGSNDTIGGTSAGARNIISGNRRVGVILSGTSNTVLEGNYIGTDVTGSVGISNVSFGVLLSNAAFTQIGGTTPGAGNVISDSAGVGIEIAGSTSTNITIQGNLIGTDATGTKPLGNSGEGILVAGGGGNRTTLTLIGGTDPGARNVISANGIGIELGGSADTANQIEGNYIGTDITGSHALGNLGDGILVQGSANTNTIGGTATGAGNVISSNAGNGVTLTDAGTSSNLVAGNFIGTDPAGRAPLANGGNGVEVTAGASGNTIGGVAPGVASVLTAGGSFTDVYGVAIASNGDLIVADSYNADLVRVNSQTGAQTVISSGGGFFSPDGVALATNGDIFVADSDISSHPLGHGQIIRVNPSTGAQTVVASNGDLIGPSDLTFGPDGNLYVADDYAFSGAGAIIRVNPITGAQMLVTEGDGSLVPGQIAFDAKGDLLAVYQSPNGVTGEVDRVDLTTGKRSTISSGGLIVNSLGLAIERDGSLLVTNISTYPNPTPDNPGIGYLIRIDPTTGAQTLAYSGGPLVFPYETTIAPNGDLYITNYGVGPAFTAELVRIPTNAARNVISGNTGDGVLITGNGTTANNVEGNYIGTDATGEAALPNSTQTNALNAGVFIMGSPDNQIGGTAAGAGNLISANANYGVFIDGGTATGNRVQGNLIGTDATGSQNLGNAFNGVLLINGASGNLIGGTTGGARNVISGNGLPGVAIAGYDDNQGLRASCH